jgi:hypothetical protein
MTDPTPITRKFVYRGHTLAISGPGVQWLIEIKQLLPHEGVQILKGWDEDEVLKRAKLRVDDLLEMRGL